MKTEQLIDELVRDLRPAPPLRPSWVRAGAWLLGAVGYLGLLTVLLTSSEDVAANGTSWRFVVPQVAAFLLAASAALAAFASTIPGASRRPLWLVGASTIIWAASLAGDAVQELGRTGGTALLEPHEWLCVVLTVGGGALPALGLAAMLRHGALMSPALTGALGVVAVASLANIAACVSHPHPSSAVILVWHGATIATLAALGAWAARRVHLASWKMIPTV